MKRIVFVLTPVFGAALGCALLSAQSQPSATLQPSTPDPGPVVLEWVPPALAQLSAQATTRSSFTLDRNLLNVAAGLMPDPDPEFRQAVNKIDGVSVHVLRFGADGIADPAQVDALREAYHLRGFKHLAATENAAGPLHNGITDVWLVVDGTNVRGAVVLAETPKSLTLVTVAGNLNPVDLFHLRGHFGIPRFEGDDPKGAQTQ